MEIGYQVIAWRRTQGLTQEAMAQRANLSRPYLSRLRVELWIPPYPLCGNWRVHWVFP